MNKKVYKYSRKERIAKYMGDSHYELTQLLKDLLAKKEDKKECEHCGSKTLRHKNYCYLHHPFENKEGIDWSKKDIYDGIKRPDLRPTPSPLDEIEEIENPDNLLVGTSDGIRATEYSVDREFWDWVEKVTKNQNRLVEVIKTLMEK